MKVFDWQQSLFLRFDPFTPGSGLALRTVAIATRIIGDTLMSTMIALINMAAESRCATAFDVSHHLQVCDG
ncbi:MAG: hypothetical protein NVSMB56_09920 [Pyrinomonadaceae bacterium]